MVEKVVAEVLQKRWAEKIRDPAHREQIQAISRAYYGLQDSPDRLWLKLVLETLYEPTEDPGGQSGPARFPMLAGADVEGACLVYTRGSAGNHAAMSPRPDSPNARASVAWSDRCHVTVAAWCGASGVDSAPLSSW